MSSVNENQSRRSFLKKAAYAAPVMVALGALSTTASAAGSSFPVKPVKPGNNGFGNGDQTAPGASLNNNAAENATGKGKGKKK